MATLKSRLEVLESTSNTNPINAEAIKLKKFGVASGLCYQKLKVSLPSDSYKYVNGHQIVYRNHISHEDKLGAIAKRINAGGITKEDQQVLEALPLDALEKMNMTASEYIVFIQELLESF